MKIGCEITRLMIEMAIRKRGPILFLRTIQRKAIRFRAAKTTAFATAILKSTANVMRAFPSGMVGFTTQRIIEATSAIIVMATRINRILC